VGVVEVTKKLSNSGVHILSATVIEKAGCWFVFLQVKIEQLDPVPEAEPVVGVEPGINCMAQVSDGSYCENPRALKRNLTKLKRQHQMVWRRHNGSANRRRAVKQLSKAYSRVGNIGRDALAQAIADVGMYEFKRQLSYC
jgi:putative transposase